MNARLRSRAFLMLLASVVAGSTDSVHASRIDGLADQRTVVEGHGTNAHEAIIDGGEPTIISIVGDGSSNLDLLVYDQGGTLIGSDTGYGDRCAAVLRPDRSGPIRIVIRNLGDTPDQYQLTIH